ncbi:hypothetical protein [Streptomyces mirabilis]|uniref:hypothetical protein n=1 Tax=Streptomyces mirabilis TaxID=68239 RepID=UPI0036DE352A
MPYSVLAEKTALIPTRRSPARRDTVDKLVPELQSRGVYRSQYRGNTLRDDLELSPLPMEYVKCGVS